VCILPFPTALVAEYLGRAGQVTAASVYNGTPIVIAICFNLLWRGASRNGRLLHEDHDRDAVRHISESYRFGPLSYVVALALAFLSVTASLLLNLALASTSRFRPGRPQRSARAIQSDNVSETDAGERRDVLPSSSTIE
jgi:hypothetical protein